MLFVRLAAIVLGLLAIAAPALAAPPPVEAYGKLPAVEQVRLSPSGQRYAFIAVIGEQRRLVAVTADGETPLYATNLGTTKVWDVHWVDDDHLLVTLFHTSNLPWIYGVRVHKAEFINVLSINVKTGSAIAVFQGHPEVADMIVGAYGVAQVGGRLYGYFGGITYDGGSKVGSDIVLTHGWPDLYRVDLDTGAISIAAHGDEQAKGWVVGPDGQVLARSSYNSTTGAWQVRTGAAGGRVLASDVSKIEAVTEMTRGRNPDTIVIKRPTPAPGSEYVELDTTGKTPDQVLDETTAGLVLDSRTGLLIGVEQRGDQHDDQFFDPGAQARFRGATKAFPGLTYQLLSYTPGLAQMMIKTSGTDDPGTIWLVDTKTGKADPIGHDYPAIRPADVGTVEMVDWRAGDGLVIHGVLSLPPGREAKNLPVIIMPHGGPELRDYAEFYWWAQLFASHGYAVLQPNFRGSSGYGDAFRNAGFGEWGRKMQTDTSDGLAALVKRGIADPKRACIVGWSFGGYIAEAGVTIQHGLYRCSVSMAGISDTSLFLGYLNDIQMGGDDIWQRYVKAYLGVTGVSDPVLDQISPAKHAAEADAPMLLLHGKDDTIVPFAHSVAMERAMRAAGKDVTFVPLAGADHWLLHEDTRLAMAKASLEFVLKHNPPDPEP